MERYYEDATMLLAAGPITEFQWAIVGVTAALILYLVIAILQMIKFRVVTPIVELTEHINNPNPDSKPM